MTTAQPRRKWPAPPRVCGFSATALGRSTVASEFFDAERFPMIELGARCPVPAAGEEWLLAGTLLVRDVLRPVVLRATAEPIDDDTVRVVLHGDISRSEFGLDWSALRQAGRLLAGDRVQLRAEVVLTRDAADGDPR
jgi:polyisoprenoid-binding protein YceI